MRTITALMATLLLISAYNAGHAAILATLTLDQHEFVVAPGDSIELWATFTLLPGSDPLAFDTNQPYPFGMDPSLIPTHGFPQFPGDVGTPYATYTRANTGTFRMCFLQVGSGCTFDEYRFYPFWSWWDMLTALEMMPGESMHFMLATVSPRDHPVTPGLYTMDNMGISLYFEGTGSTGEFVYGALDVAETCPDRTPECRLSINVVPLPAAVWLFLAALPAFWRRRSVK